MQYAAAPDAGATLHTHHHKHEAFYLLSDTLQFALGEHPMAATAQACTSIFPKRQRPPFRNSTAELAPTLIILNVAGLKQFFVDLAALAAWGAAS
jgi:hypothetical protein